MHRRGEWADGTVAWLLPAGRGVPLCRQCDWERGHTYCTVQYSSHQLYGLVKFKLIKIKTIKNSVAQSHQACFKCSTATHDWHVAAILGRAHSGHTHHRRKSCQAVLKMFSVQKVLCSTKKNTWIYLSAFETIHPVLSLIIKVIHVQGRYVEKTRKALGWPLSVGLGGQLWV